MANSSSIPGRYPGRIFLALGLVLTVMGILGYVVQIWAQRLTTPWYLPASATLGVVFLIISLRRARTVWRICGLVFVVLLAGAEWAFLLGARQPAYVGPVAEKQPFPVFATMRADGSPFTQHDLQGKQNSVLVFFRGRW
jgi:hypothetical protein